MKKLVVHTKLGGWLLVIFLMSCSEALVAQINAWQVNASDYEYSMTITAVVQYADGAFSVDADDMIALFDADGNCVGSAPSSVYFSPLEANLAFVMVYANSTSVEYNAKLYIATEDTIVDVEGISFSVNQELGSLSAPHVFSMTANTDVLGCTDASAFNYDALASQDDGSCIAVVLGCVDEEATNYNSTANTADDSCDYSILGCTNNAYLEYNTGATTDDGSCETLYVEAYATLNGVLAELNANIADLNEQNASLEGQLSSSLASQLDAEATVDSISNLMSTIEATITDLNSSIQSLEEANASLTNSLNESLSTQENLQIELSNYGDSIVVLSATNSELITTNSNLTSSLNESLESQENLQSTVTSYSDSINAISAEVLSLSELNAQMSAQIDSLNNLLEGQEPCTAYTATIDLPEGWSMFGYPMADSVNVMDAFVAEADKIVIVKDEWGLAWITEYNYNALGALQYGEGYQIKTTEEILQFEF